MIDAGTMMCSAFCFPWPAEGPENDDMGLGTDTPAPFTGAAGGDKDHTRALAQYVMGCERAVEAFSWWMARWHSVELEWDCDVGGGGP